MRTLLAFLLLSIPIVDAALPEPDVVFYGRVLHLGGGEEYVVTSGELTWRVHPLGGTQYLPFETTTQLGSLNGGTMSYSIRVPNHLVVAGTVTGVSPGLAVSEGGLPFRNTEIAIDGSPVRLADPEGVAFDVSSENRSSFRRLDLILDGALPDGDGDGLPDWWESKYGTNGQLADAQSDLDGDGSNNLAEYLAGTNPTADDLQPKIASEVLVSLPVSGGAVPSLRAIDGDSAPHHLVYVATGIPSDVEIDLVGREGWLTTAFTQDDVDAGRVIIRHLGSKVGARTIRLTLRDEDPAHEAVETLLRVSIGEDETLWEGWELMATSRPATLPVVHDASRLSRGTTLRAPSSDGEIAAEDDYARLYLGSPQADEMFGSAQDDLLVLASGDSASGGKGADRFLLGGGTDPVLLTDYSVSEGDILDLRGLIGAAGDQRLEAYVQQVGREFRIDANGDGSGYTDLTVTFGEEVALLEPAELWEQGLLETGGIVPQTTLLLTTSGSPSEEGLASAMITVRRRGEASAPLQVPLTWSGTATLGRDYVSLPSMASFAVGQKEVHFTLQPLADDIRETDETVQLELGTGAEWTIADGSRTTSLRIADLPSRAWLEPVERVAYKDSGSPAQVLVRRSGPMNAPLTVTLQVRGGATANLDYQRLPASVTFGVAQDVIPLEIVPLAVGTSSSAKEVIVSVKADASYLFGEITEASMLIYPRPQSIASWLSTQEVTTSQAAFLESDDDGDGLSGLLEFAFNGNPQAQDSWKVRGLLNASGQIGLEYERRPGAPELRYALQQSSDLKVWTEVSASAFEETVTELLPSGLERVEAFLKEIPQNAATYLKVHVD